MIITIYEDDLAIGMRAKCYDVKIFGRVERVNVRDVPSRNAACIMSIGGNWKSPQYLIIRNYFRSLE